jgi:hypothetical protein
MPTVVTFSPVRPNTLCSSLIGELGVIPVGLSDDGQIPTPELVSPMLELAPMTGRIKPADKKSRRDVFGFIMMYLD